MFAHSRVVHKKRETITALPLHYSGTLLKRERKDEDFKTFYAELRGATLFLYENDSQDTYTDKLFLEDLKSMELESPYKNMQPCIFTLTLPTGEVQLKLNNPDKGEEWRCYILTVTKRQIPSKVQLLPGQVSRLEDALAEERRRKNLPMFRPELPPRPAHLNTTPISPPLTKDKPDHDSELPKCFFNVTREEAKRMLEANPEYGSMILRPSKLPNNYAVTLRQVMSSGPVVTHYRVTSTNAGFIIELDEPVTVSSLDSVLKYFLEKTEYRFQPYMPSEPYNTRIDLAPAPEYITMRPFASKTVPKAEVVPMQKSQTKDVFPSSTNKGVEAQLNEELLEAFKKLKKPVNATAGKMEVITCEGETSEDSKFKVQWNPETAAK
uniref:signal-transducing adaptor protein 1-like n=1 Tax=Scatophagus argus TaxID=75038 RepID=UPI001ED7CFA2|nr:signal-transducing adaptor protein 1-like [Scatophagus argus]